MTQDKQKKILRGYMLLAGATLPAFTAITVYSAKRKYYQWDKKQIMLFVGVATISSIALVYLANKKKLM